MRMFYNENIVIVSCDLGSTVIVDFITGDIKLLDLSSSWIVTINLD